MKYLGLLFMIFFSATVFAEAMKAPLIDDLHKAYQKEILFLMSYKNEIEKKMRELDHQVGSRLDQARSELKTLEQKYLQMQTRNDLAQKRLADLESESLDKVDSRQALQGVIEQASYRFGKDLFEGKELLEQLQIAYQKSLENLNQAHRIQSAPGEFYQETGAAVKGEIVSLGSIAKYGLTDRGAFSLYPAGEGNFKVWKSIPKTEALALKEGYFPPLLSAFVFEDAQKAFQPKQEKSMGDIAQAGGPIGAVIIALGLVGFILALVRLRGLKGSQGRGHTLKQKLDTILQDGNFEKAQEMVLAEKSAVGRLSRKLLENVNRGRAALEDLAGEAVIRESQKLDRFSSILMVFASVAPLLGLLGTVTGMIATFDTITEFGTGNPKLLSGGISEALVTTMFGLVVAIPTLLVGQVLGSWGDKIKGDLEQTALLIINAVTRKETLEGRAGAGS